MPNIRTYTAQDVGLHPDERGSQALAREAGSLGSVAQSQQTLGEAQAGAARASGQGTASLGQELGQGVAAAGQGYIKYRTNQQIGQGAAALAGMQDDLTKAWNQQAKDADPNDTSIGPAFHEKTLEPALDQFVNSFDTEEGQQWARNQAASMRQHFFEKTAADSATRAGMAVVTNLTTLSNRAQNLVRQDPSSLDAALGLIDNSVHAIVSTNPNLTADASDKAKGGLTQAMKGAVVTSAMVGTIEANPDAGLALVNSGKYADYINGDTVKALTTYAADILRKGAEQARLDAAEQRRQTADAAKAETNGIVASVIQGDGSVRLGPNFFRDVLTHVQNYGTNADAESLIRFGQWAADQGDKPAHVLTDPTTYASFADRINRDDTDPQRLTMGEILDARTKNLLNDSDFQHFADIQGRERKPEEKAEDKVFHAFVTSFKGNITKSTALGTVDAHGDQRFFEFTQNADRLRAAYKAAGKSDADLQTAIRGSIPAFVPTKMSGRRELANAALPPVVNDGKTVVIPKGIPLLPGYVDTGGGRVPNLTAQDQALLNKYLGK